MADSFFGPVQFPIFGRRWMIVADEDVNRLHSDVAMTNWKLADQNVNKIAAYQEY